MKKKTISAVISKKFNEWVSTIDDEKVKSLVQKNTICTGGCIASMLLREKVNDFDFYFRDVETCYAVADYYVKKFKENPPPKFANQQRSVDIWVRREGDRVSVVVKSAGIASEDEQRDYRYFESIPDAEVENAAEEYVETAMEILEVDKEGKPDYRPVFLTSNAITLSNKVQVVLRFHGDPDKIHENYDFVHCTNYWTSWDKKVVLKAEALESLLTKELRYVGSKYPLCSFIRTRKFVARGWTINAGQYLKMAMQLNALDLNKLEVLEDQMVGVDAAYFMQVLDYLRSKDSTKVDTAYLTEIIDRIF